MASGVLKARLAELSPEVRTFQRAVLNQREAHPLGLFYKKTNLWTWAGVVVGAGAVLVPIGWYFSRNPRWAPLMPDWWVWVAIVFGALMLGAALDTLLRLERSRDYLGRFEFVGPRSW